MSAAATWRLPFARHVWRGSAGNWAGAGTGSSLDFQDHRGYAPGDDPRHIHWQAFARTGILTMKLYRAEVAPFVDVVVDASPSMTVTEAKAARVRELAEFCAQSARQAGAPLRVRSALGAKLREVPAADVRQGAWRPPAAAEPAADSGEEMAPGPVAWRGQAIKVLISDLLFPGDPSAVLVSLAAGIGTAIVLAPGLADEAELPWRGEFDLSDCESARRRRQRFDAPVLQRYRQAYARHFALWREAARRRGVLLARVPCEGDLNRALSGEAFAVGAVEAGR